MPKFRNMARMLNTDHNFLVLNVSFYDSLRSGFPIFGIIDGLSTPEYRDWFTTAEGLSFFPPRDIPASCESTISRQFLTELERGRSDPAVWRVPLLLSVEVFATGEANGTA